MNGRAPAALLALAVLALLTQPFRPAAGQSKPAAPSSGNVFGGFAARSDAPIDIDARRLDVDDGAKTAIFTGDVVAVQGDYVLKAPVLEVYYEGKATDAAMMGSGSAVSAVAAPTSGEANAATQISRILAKGPVVVDGKDGQRLTGDAVEYDVQRQTATVNGNVILIQGRTGQRATSDIADYDAANEVAVLRGNVVLTQGENVVKGDRLWMNFKTNESKLETSTAAAPAPGPDGKACPAGRVCLHFPGEQKK